MCRLVVPHAKIGGVTRVAEICRVVRYDMEAARNSKHSMGSTPIMSEDWGTGGSLTSNRLYLGILQMFNCEI